MKIRLTKLSDRPDPTHPNSRAGDGEHWGDAPYGPPEVGKRFYLTLSFSTSVVQEIIDECTFKTLNSIYRWDILNEHWGAIDLATATKGYAYAQSPSGIRWNDIAMPPIEDGLYLVKLDRGLKPGETKVGDPPFLKKYDTFRYHVTKKVPGHKVPSWDADGWDGRDISKYITHWAWIE
jgi:hypothetical protein